MVRSILFVAYKMDLGGTEKALLAMLNALKSERVKVTLLLMEPGGILERLVPKFVDIVYVENFFKLKPIIEDPPIFTLKKYLLKGKFVSSIRLLTAYLKDKSANNWYHHFDLVLRNTPHFGSHDIAIAYAGPLDFITYLVANKVDSQNKIQWIHFDIEKVLPSFNFGQKFYPEFRKIFCVSKSAKEVFLKHFPGLADRTKVFNNIISRSDIIAQANAGDTFEDRFAGLRILTVGRFTEEKGQHLIPEIVRKLKAEGKNIRWYLIGDGHERKKLMQQAKDLGVADDIVFMGAKQNPYSYMQACDIYVQTSLHEGYGITVAEAKIFNKPIVVTNFLSAKDLITDNETGLIADISAQGIYDALLRLVNDEAMRKRFSERLREEKELVQTQSVLQRLL